MRLPSRDSSSSLLFPHASKLLEMLSNGDALTRPTQRGQPCAGHHLTGTREVPAPEISPPGNRIFVRPTPVPDTDPEAARHPPRRALPLHATARPTLPRAGPTPAASGQTPPPPLPPSPRLSSRPHPSTHPPASPPSTATTPLPSSLSPLTSTSPSPPRSPSLTRARTRPPPTDRSRLDLVQEGGRARTAAGREGSF
ncbi:hypothetical protein SORBI_3010G074366 [Sorghum bicolor]|uniref:Uncharacterized protein n=1 Tax=Sorghum bicolor TaxID=4558 RepID=A0A1W0VRV1_SORBI|nr:hypothetical protein SORBI_3010G074366 [Sorghum bicolor]